MGLAALPGMLGVLQLIEPAQPPFTGRWSWLETMLFANFGPRGMGTLSLSIALVMLSRGYIAWRNEKM